LLRTYSPQRLAYNSADVTLPMNRKLQKSVKNSGKDSNTLILGLAGCRKTFP
jgi:hypothetical protein